MNTTYLDCEKCGNESEAATSAKSVICDLCVQRMVGAPELPKVIEKLPYEERKARKERREERKQQQEERIALKRQRAMEKMERENQRALKKQERERLKQEKQLEKMERKIKWSKIVTTKTKPISADPNKKPQGWHKKLKFEWQGIYYSRGIVVSKSKYEKIK